MAISSRPEFEEKSNASSGLWQTLAVANTAVIIALIILQINTNRVLREQQNTIVRQEKRIVSMESGLVNHATALRAINKRFSDEDKEKKQAMELLRAFQSQHSGDAIGKMLALINPVVR